MYERLPTRKTLKESAVAMASLVMVLLMVSSVVSMSAGAAMAQSPQDSNEVIEIEDWYDLAGVGGETGTLDGHYKLVSDLDENTPGYGGDGEDGVVLTANGQLAGSDGFTPIGHGELFEGKFDGGNHEISGLVISNSNEAETGLFGDLGPEAKVSNLQITNAEVSGDSVTGILTARNRGEIKNVAVEGDVNGENGVGGVAGVSLNGQIIRGVVEATVRGNKSVGGVVGVQHGSSVVSASEFEGQVRSTDGKVGGVVGDNDGAALINVEASGSVSVVGNSLSAGGLAGDNSGVIKNGTSRMNVRSEFHYVGGIAGSNEGILTQTQASGDVTGLQNVGGVVGINTDGAVVQESKSTGTIVANDYAGGVVGSNVGEIANTYTHSSVKSDGVAGGIVGRNDKIFGDVGAIRTSYTTGDVHGELTGPIAGEVRGGTIESTYWDTRYTSDEMSHHLPNTNGLSTAAITGSAATENMSTFDFENVWDVGEEYPELQSMDNRSNEGTSDQKVSDGPRVPDVAGNDLYTGIAGEGFDYCQLLASQHPT